MIYDQTHMVWTYWSNSEEKQETAKSDESLVGQTMGRQPKLAKYTANDIQSTDPIDHWLWCNCKARLHPVSGIKDLH